MVVIAQHTSGRACQVRAPLTYLAHMEYQHLRRLLLSGVGFEYGFTAGCVTVAKDLPCASASPIFKKKKKWMWAVLTLSCFGD